MQKYRFHTANTPPKDISKIRHALAIDERRHDFQAEVWSETGTCDDLEQRWFSGVHSNVGGGLIDDSLANCALRWMCDEAAASGLALNPAYLSFFHEYPEGRASRKSLSYRLVDTVMRPVRGFRGDRDLVNTPKASLDESVLRRLNAQPGNHKSLETKYRPKNLLNFLASNPQYDSELNSELRQQVSVNGTGSI